MSLTPSCDGAGIKAAGLVIEAATDPSKALRAGLGFRGLTAKRLREIVEDWPKLARPSNE